MWCSSDLARTVQNASACAAKALQPIVASVNTERRFRFAPGTESFLEHVVTGWLEPLAAAISQDGTDPRIAPAAARLSMAVTRGLLLDLLATHDTKGVTEAFELFLQLGAVVATERDSR